MRIECVSQLSLCVSGNVSIGFTQLQRAFHEVFGVEKRHRIGQWHCSQHVTCLNPTEAGMTTEAWNGLGRRRRAQVYARILHRETLESRDP